MMMMMIIIIIIIIVIMIYIVPFPRVQWRFTFYNNSKRARLALKPG